MSRGGGGVTAITEPGVYSLPDEVYHADPVPGGSLSASGAKTLLRAPALYKWEREHGRPPARHYDLGHAAHRHVLGVGADLEVVNAADWRTKAAREQRDKAREAGRTPILAHEHEQVQAMAAALRQHPLAAALLNPERGGKPEQSLFWRDSDVWLRARLDWLPRLDGPHRPVIADYKTCDSASLPSVRRAVANYGYYIQDAWYRAAVDNVLGAQAAFCFIFQERTPPYLVTVVQLSEDAQEAGHRAMRAAIDLWRQCVESGIWPGYVGDQEIPEIDLPPWTDRYEEYA